MLFHNKYIIPRIQCIIIMKLAIASQEAVALWLLSSDGVSGRNVDSGTREASMFEALVVVL